MYGWDWGAHLPDAGIFRDVTLLGVKKARIDSVYVTQRHEEDKVTLHVSPSFILPRQFKKEFSFEDLTHAADTDFTYNVTVTDPEGNSQTISGKALVPQWAWRTAPLHRKAGTLCRRRLTGHLGTQNRSAYHDHVYRKR